VKRILFIVFMISMLIFLGSGFAFATPSLQLDIKDGVYYTSSSTPSINKESIVATTDPFDLYAYLIPDKDSTLTDDYYLSVAVLPPLKESAAGYSLGSFSVDGQPIVVTSDMFYGTPPVALLPDGDLPTHSVFPTYFIEISFNFDAADYSKVYNTQDDAGSGPMAYTSGDKMYYVPFAFDTRNLAAGYALHFDLYQLDTDSNIIEKAPFSHDANSQHVPEPGTLLLLGLGLVGLSGLRRKF